MWCVMVRKWRRERRDVNMKKGVELEAKERAELTSTCKLRSPTLPCTNLSSFGALSRRLDKYCRIEQQATSLRCLLFRCLLSRLGM